MSNQAIFNPLSLTVSALFLVSLTGIRVTYAADAEVDPQAQAARMLQHPVTRIAGTDSFNQSGHASGKILDPQEQAQRVLQPVNDGTTSVSPDNFTASQSAEPQLQAARMLSRNLN